MANTDTISKCLNTARTVISEGISYWNAPGYDRRRQDAELEDATGNKLADAETVKTLQAEKEELEQRVEELENVGKESKTLTDAQSAEEDFDWSTADDGVSYDPATGSMSR